MTESSERRVAPWRVTYQPGEWTLLSGPAAMVVLEPAPARASAVVTQVWELVVSASTAGELVSRLVEVGLDAMQHLAVVFRDADGLHALLRGGAVILDPEGAELAAGSGALTWRESDLHGDVIEIAMPGATRAEDVVSLPLLAGAAQVGWVRVDAAEGAVPRVAESMVSEPEPAPAPEPEPSPQPEPPPEPAPEPWPEPEPEAEPGREATSQLPPWLRTPVPAPRPGQRDRGYAATPGAPHVANPYGTSPWAPPDSPYGAADAWTPLAAGQGDAHDGETVFQSQIAATHRHTGPAVPSTDQQPPVLADLRTNDGTRQPIGVPVLIGRAPSAERHDPASVLVRVPSPSHDISRTHLMVDHDGASVRVTDLHSTNGTIIIQPGSAPQRLSPGQTVAVAIGSVIDLGDGVTIDVVPHGA